MTEQELDQVVQVVREEIRKVLAEKTPYRGGWFTAIRAGDLGAARRWRDPETGEVWDSPAKTISWCMPKNFDITYTNVRWEDEPAKTEWPPKGLPVLVQWEPNHIFVYAESNGQGKFRDSPEGFWGDVHAWKYIPANWENAPEWTKQWVITSLGAQFWSSVTFKVGEGMAESGYVVHVEGRPEEEA